MDTVLSTLIQNPGWGFLAVVIILVIVNPSFISELTKLVDRLLKPKEPTKYIEYGNYKLFKLERTLPGTGIVNCSKILSTIFSAILIVILSYLYYLISTKPPVEGISTALPLSFVFFFVLPIVNLIDNYAHIRSSVNLELDGDFETLLRFCLKTLFDTKATVTKFDVAGEIKARLYGNEITIKIEKLENSRNKFTLNSDGRLINTLVYSVEYRRSINNLVRSLCYNPQVQTRDSR